MIIIDDSTFEGRKETFVLSLTSNDPAINLTGITNATIAIVDNDRMFADSTNNYQPL